MSRGGMVLAVIVILILLVLLGLGSFLVFRLAQEAAPTVPLAEETPLATPQAEATPLLPAENLLRVPGGVPITFDPALAQDSVSIEYIRLIFSGLVTLDEDLRVVPDIAENWEVSPDGRTYTFHLRQDAFFHNGRQATAQDFQYSIERATDPSLGSPVALTYLGDILGVAEKLDREAAEVDGVVVRDDFTVEITLVEPVVHFLAKLTYPTAFLVDQEQAEGGEPLTNGTGPFRILSSILEKISLGRNENYYRHPVALERLDFLLSGDPLALYERGELDFAQVGPQDIARVKDLTSPFVDELVVVPGLSTFYIGFNVQVPPFDDLKVRQALAYATPRQSLIEIVLGDTALEAFGVLPPGMPGYNPDLAGIPFDPERAQELLAESSYGSAEELPPIVLSTADPGLGQILAETYAEILGVSIEVQPVNFSTLLGELEDGRGQMFLLGWGADYADPQNFLEINFHSQSQGNYARYSNLSVDDLLEEARVERNEERRLELYRQAEKTIVPEAPWIPLFHDLQYVLIKPYVQGLVVTPLGPLYAQASLEGFER